MSDIPRIGSLEIDQDLDYQRWEWLFERVSWFVMLLLLGAGLLGLLGPGLLSSRSITSAGGELRVEYDAFLQLQTGTPLRIHLTGAEGQTIRLWLSENYLENVRLVDVSPRPERIEIGKHRHEYVFSQTPQHSDIRIVFRLQPERVGPLQGQIGLGSVTLDLDQFVYP